VILLKNEQYWQQAYLLPVRVAPMDVGFVTNTMVNKMTSVAVVYAGQNAGAGNEGRPASVPHDV
jgi:hypothetical protein